MIVPGRNGHKINATVENARFAIANDVLTLKYQQAVDGIQASIDDSVNCLMNLQVNHQLHTTIIILIQERSDPHIR